MERKPISGILIINNIKSVEEILLIIQKYTRVFTANPIRILCCDAEKDAADKEARRLGYFGTESG